MGLSSNQKTSLVFLDAFLTVGIVLSTMVFTFWNLIRENVYEEGSILTNDEKDCYVETKVTIPKTMDDCTLNFGNVTRSNLVNDLHGLQLLNHNI